MKNLVLGDLGFLCLRFLDVVTLRSLLDLVGIVVRIVVT